MRVRRRHHRHRRRGRGAVWRFLYWAVKGTKSGARYSTVELSVLVTSTGGPATVLLAPGYVTLCGA